MCPFAPYGPHSHVNRYLSANPLPNLDQICVDAYFSLHHSTPFGPLVILCPHLGGCHLTFILDLLFYWKKFQAQSRWFNCSHWGINLSISEILYFVHPFIVRQTCFFLPKKVVFISRISEYMSKHLNEKHYDGSSHDDLDKPQRNRVKLVSLPSLFRIYRKYGTNSIWKSYVGDSLIHMHKFHVVDEHSPHFPCPRSSFHFIPLRLRW